jgi:hypothetical protein
MTETDPVRQAYAERQSRDTARHTAADTAQPEQRPARPPAPESLTAGGTPASGYTAPTMDDIIRGNY